MIHPGDSSRLNIDGRDCCNPDHPWCGSPNQNKAAERLWNQCWDESSLDFFETLPITPLPPCVPNLTARQRLVPRSGTKFVAAKATDIGGILSRDQSKLRKWRRVYAVPQNAVLLLHQESLDVWQEKLSQIAEMPGYFELIRLLGKKTVYIGTGYSVYDDGSMCPIRQILNLRRSIFEAAQANRAGLASVPTIGWNKGRATDLEMIGNWLGRQGPKVQTLAVNAQTGTNSQALTEDLGRGMLQIEHIAGTKPHWIVFGGRQRIETLIRFLPRERITQVARPKDFQVPQVDRSGHFQVQHLLGLINPVATPCLRVSSR